MRYYLQQVAIQTKVENFRDFGKTKDETAKAISVKFQVSETQAMQWVDAFWGSESEYTGGKLEKILVSLKKEKHDILQEYDRKISIVECAITGMTPEAIAEKHQVNLKYVEQILG